MEWTRRKGWGEKRGPDRMQRKPSCGNPSQVGRIMEVFQEKVA